MRPDTHDTCQPSWPSPHYRTATHKDQSSTCSSRVARIALIPEPSYVCLLVGVYAAAADANREWYTLAAMQGLSTGQGHITTDGTSAPWSRMESHAAWNN